MQNEYYGGLCSEGINPRTREIDLVDTKTMLCMIHAEDEGIPAAVGREIDNIARAVDMLYDVLSKGGRMIYVGAGTSGRLGVLDASECPPTYGTPPEMVQAFIAGGDTALRTAVEGAEDDAEAGRALMDEQAVGPDTVVVGITASGTAPYVLGAMERAMERGAGTVGVATNQNAPLAELVDVAIAPEVGPEVIMGSTRMKSGTAQKLVLNMLTTGVMIRLGKVYENMMVDLHATNAKLKARSARMLRLITDATQEEAEAALERADGELKTAVIMLLTGMEKHAARAALSGHGGRLRETLREMGETQ